MNNTILVAGPPPMPGFMTPMPPPMAPVGAVGMKHPMDTAMEEEPSNKKARNEDSLVPEEVYMARNPVSTNFCLKHLNMNLTITIFIAESNYGESIDSNAAGKDRMEA